MFSDHEVNTGRQRFGVVDALAGECEDSGFGKVDFSGFEVVFLHAFTSNIRIEGDETKTWVIGLMINMALDFIVIR